MDNSISHGTTLRMLETNLEDTDSLTFLLKYTQLCRSVRKYGHLIDEYIIKEGVQSYKYHLVNIKTKNSEADIQENLFLLSVCSSTVLTDPLKLSFFINSIYL